MTKTSAANFEIEEEGKTSMSNSKGEEKPAAMFFWRKNILFSETFLILSMKLFLKLSVKDF